MIRPINIDDKETYLAFVSAFYNSEAVAHKVDEQNFEETFYSLIDGNPYYEGYMLEEDGKPVGYMLGAKTYSQEAGGMVMWLDELYILPEYRGKGIGAFAVMYLEGKCAKEGFRRVRLEYTEENEGAHKFYRKLGIRDLKYKQMQKDF